MRRQRATVQWRHLVNWREAARCGEWAQHFSNASCLESGHIAQPIVAAAVGNTIFLPVGHLGHPYTLG